MRSLGRVAVQPLPGSAGRGATLYESHGCAACHVIAGRGRIVGPELTSIGELRGAAISVSRSSTRPPLTHQATWWWPRGRRAASSAASGLGEDVFWVHIRDATGTVHVLHKPELAGLDRELQATLMPSYSRACRPVTSTIWSRISQPCGAVVKSRLAIVVAVTIGATVHAAGQVTLARLTTGTTADGNWLMYSGTYASHRFSPLDQITVDNVGPPEGAVGFSTPGRRAAGGDADRRRWGDVRDLRSSRRRGTPCEERASALGMEPSDGTGVLNLGFPRVNRGVALLDDMVYVGTLDGYLVALDAKSGVQRWIAHVGDNTTGHAITAAPLVADGKVIVGLSGGEAGIRGYLDAYDAATGTRVWRVYTVPSPGEPGSDTWEGDSWKFGAGATWLTGSYDPALKLLYWGTGNPGPDWNGDARKGDNLYTCSLLALDVETGKRRWHFQFTPHDTHDWDANQIPVLVDGEFRGRARALVVMANRNGFFYVLDRTPASTSLGAQYARADVGQGLDDRGRPILIPNMAALRAGTLVYPSLQGSTNWSSPSYSPATGLLYVPVREMGSIYFKSPAEYRPGTYFTGGSEKALDEEAWGAVRAIEVATGKVVWDFRLPTPPWAGVMATAGGVVFGGSNEGNFYALDARTGKPSGSSRLAAPFDSGPMAFLADGKQRIAVAGGRGFYVFGLD